MYRNIHRSIMTALRFLAIGFAIAGFLFTIPSMAQNATGGSEDPPRINISFEVVDSSLRSFEPPVTLGAGKDAVRYEKALVLVVEVDRWQFEEFSPSLAPYLAIGRELLGIHRQELTERGDRIRLTFHAPDWRRLEEGEPMYLTTDLESTLKQERKPTRDTPRFQLDLGRR